METERRHEGKKTRDDMPGKKSVEASRTKRPSVFKHGEVSAEK